MHDLPRQLSVAELDELFEGHTRLTEELARRQDPLGQARAVLEELPEDARIEALNTHPRIGETGGSETVSLLESEIPNHTHAMQASTAPGNSKIPAGNVVARATGGNVYLPAAGRPLVAMSDQALAPSGGDQPHNNLQPYLTFYFAIALQGVFPPRT